MSRSTRLLAPCVGLLALGLGGCTHNHYYYSGGDGVMIEGARSSPTRLGQSSNAGQTIVLDEPAPRVVRNSSTRTVPAGTVICDDGSTVVLSDPPLRTKTVSKPRTTTTLSQACDESSTFVLSDGSTIPSRKVLAGPGSGPIVISRPSTRSVASRNGSRWYAVDDAPDSSNSVRVIGDVDKSSVVR